MNRMIYDTKFRILFRSTTVTRRKIEKTSIDTTPSDDPSQFVQMCASGAGLD